MTIRLNYLLFAKLESDGELTIDRLFSPTSTKDWERFCSTKDFRILEKYLFKTIEHSIYEDRMARIGGTSLTRLFRA